MPRNFSSIPGAFWCRAGAGISAPFPVSVPIHRDFGGHGGIPWELKFRPCAQGSRSAAAADPAQRGVALRKDPEQRQAKERARGEAQWTLRKGAEEGNEESDGK